MELSKEQQKAVQSLYQHNMILAGAGTGKTRTIIHRIFFLLKQNVEAKKIVVLTFTRKSTNEIIYRLKNENLEASAKIFVGTFHQFCIINIRKYNDFFSNYQYRIIDREEQLRIIRDIKSEIKEENSFTPSELLQYISYAKNCNIKIQNYLEKYESFQYDENQIIISIANKYQKKKIQQKYLDFDDILVDFAEQVANQEKLREILWKQYDHCLVDEMQDTNPIQWKMLSALAKKISLFCVGDDAQSIYMFRGADFRNVQNFHKNLDNAKKLQLTQNYRSTQEILDIANWLLAESSLPYNKKLIAYRGKGKMPQLHTFHNDKEEAKWIVEEIKRNHQKNKNYQDQMILVRSAWNAKLLESQLVEESIPYVFIGGVNLMASAHVKDLLSLLQIIVFPHDELAWIRYLCLWPKLGKKTAQKIYQQIALKEKFSVILSFLESALPKYRLMIDTIKTIAENKNTPNECLNLALQHLEDLLEVNYNHWEYRKKDFYLLSEMASRFKNLKDFLEVYTLEPIYSNNNDLKDKLTVITVHSAKGIEAKICYLLQAQEMVYPHKRAIGNLEAEEEERRVLYVAMTRAKDQLYITRSYQNFHYSLDKSLGEENYFLRKVPKDIVQHQNHFYDY